MGVSPWLTLRVARAVLIVSFSGIIAAFFLRPTTHHAQHSDWHVGLALQTLGRKVLSREVYRLQDARLLLRPIRYRRDQQQLLHVAQDRDALRLARGDAAELRVCDQGQPVPYP